MLSRRLAATLVAVAAGIPLVALPTAPASAAGCGAFFDANGDGSDDLVVGVPREDLSVGGVNRVDVGSVTVVYGDPAGTFGTHGSELIDQGTLGLTSVAGDRFGASVVTADLNGDGCADLAVGAPGKASGAGAVVIVWGSPTGLVIASPQVLKQGTTPVKPGTAEPGDGFGATLAPAGSSPTGGAAALWVGSPGEDVGSVKDAGMITELKTAVGGLLGAAGSTNITQDSPGVPGAAEPGDQFGERLSGGARTLLVGVPHEDVGSLKDAGSYDALDLSHRSWTSYTQDTVGVPGAAEAGDQFGSSVAHAAGCASAIDESWAVGSAGEDVGSATDAGSVTLRDRESKAGLNLVQGAGGIPGPGEKGDGFGASLVDADVLVIGAPGEDVGSVVDSGAVTAVELGCSATDQPVVTSATTWSQATAGVPGPRSTGNTFGASLGASLVAVTGLPLQYRLVVGSPGETDGTAKGSGRVTVFGASPSGLSTSGATAFGQGSLGMGTPETGDGFGGGLDASNATVL
jgi:FG-GAP repeat